MSSWPSVHTEYWLRALSERGHEVHFLFPLKHEVSFDELPKGVRLHRFDWQPKVKGTGTFTMALELRRKLKEIAPDIFHIHSVFAVSDWRLFPWVFSLTTFHPLVLTAWGGDLLNTPNKSKAGRLFVKRALRAADLITADSQSLLDAAQSLGAGRDKLHEIQFGVDTEMLSPRVDTSEVRARLSLGSGPVVYSPRAFMPVYNQLSIVEAAHVILQTQPDCRFIFKIRSDHHSAEEEARVRERIKELGIERSVRIISDLPYAELPALYALADVIVSVPDFDGTPRSVLEAMACGAFPVVSDVAALREWITDDDNGLFVREAEPEEIARAVLKALASRELLERAKVKNREIVETRASSRYWVARMEDLYNSLTRRG
ncbi:MAG TPA: glycosyltransferase family 4 protein [Pyrinomonadaceae bacterium]|nr:glycosyltransferase family 4 protein [Pyrinomonadaceae bacterium]